MPPVVSSFASRLAAVEERIQTAAERCRRTRESIRLIAVSKKFGPEAIAKAYECGLREFGENYVQEFAGKQPSVAHLEGARFHLIGHLQSNKTKLAAQIFQSIQTVDSPKLMRRLQEATAEARLRLEVLIEVKLSTEESKSGCAPEEIEPIVETRPECPNVDLVGLMTVPPWSENPEESRPYFQRLAELARRYGLKELSMGMSNDFEVAIEEGATVIRVGTALFGSRPKPV